MRKILSPLFIGIFLLLFLSDSKPAKSQEMNATPDLVVEGIFYMDNSPIEIGIKDGKIATIKRKASLSNPAFADVYISPGFIDHQVNGYLSYSFVGEELTIEQIRQITAAFWKEGITTYLPTLTTHSNERLLKNFGILNKALQHPEISQSVPGFHLEGPYISPLDGFRGVHPKAHIRKPDWKEFSAWYEASGKNILEVTIAPELEDAIGFMEQCQQYQIVVALGHHNGSAAIIKQAVDVGASVSTHLGNGCANTIHRHENPLWPQLAEDRLSASIIVDGFHLRPEEVQTFYKVKGPDRTILVSDLVRLAGSPPGTYEDFGTSVVVTADGKVMMPSQDVLAGASFLITKGIANMMKFTQCSLAEAVDMASRNPARLLNLKDRGEIRVGKRADLVWFKMDDAGELAIQQTMVGGKIVFK